MNPLTPPPLPTGSKPFYTWAQWVQKKLASLTPIKTPTVGFNWSEKGIRYNAAPPGGIGTTVQLYVVTQLYGGADDQAFDYFGATPFDATANAISGSQIICAKCLDARGPMQETIDGELIQYGQYYNDNQRYALNTYTNAGEFQSINNRYMIYDPGGVLEQYVAFICRTVNATGVLGPDNQPIYYLEMQPFRRWCYNPALNGG